MSEHPNVDDCGYSVRWCIPRRKSKALLPFSYFIAYLVAYFSADKTSPG
jgi:hypothetical protein